MNPKTIALIVFILMYILMIALPRHRKYYALAAALIYLIAGIMPLRELGGAISWNVLLMITGTMVLVSFFIDSGMPKRMADLLLAHSGNVMWVTIYMSLFAGIISAFIDNVATVLIVAPVALAVCRKLKVNPTAMIISIAVSSNLQGAATLVGDTTSIMLGNYAKMDFLKFFWMQGRPGIFFAVELGALATVPVLMILFRRDKEPVSSDEVTEVKDILPSVLLLVMVAALIAASFIPEKPEITNGLICMALAAFAVILYGVFKRHHEKAQKAILETDLDTILLLLGLFVVIGGVTEVGIIDDIASLIVRVGGRNLFLLYTLIVWGSVAASAFIDNIPYVATMLPVVTGIASSIGIAPELLYFGLLTGATLGGNLTPIGASANITAVGMLRKQGHEVSFRQFMRIGVPLTLTAVAVGYLFIWIFWA